MIRKKTPVPRRKNQMTRSEVIQLLRHHINETYGTASAASEAWGVSSAFTSAVLNNPNKQPNERMLRDLGYSRTTVYVRNPDGAALDNRAQKSTER